MSDKGTDLVVFEPDEPTFDLTVVYNPLDVTDRTLAKMNWQSGRPLSKYLDGLPQDPIDWAVSINGEVMPRDRWEVIYPSRGDSLVLIPIPHGGGGGGGKKNILGMIAMLVVMAVSIWVSAGALAPVWGAAFAAGSIGASIAGIAVSVIGGILVSALFPAAQASNPVSSLSSPTDTPDSQTYGIDGPKNTSTEAVCVPLVYGTFRVAGNVTDQRVDNIGDQQYLYLRMIVSEGEINSFDTSSILINGEPIANFTGISVDTRTGTDNQAVGGWFNRSVREVNQSRKLDTSFFIYTTQTDVEAIRLDFTFPNGLYFVDTQGNRNSTAVSIQIEISPTGLGQWVPFIPGQDVITVSNSTRSAMRWSWESQPLAFGTYDVRVRRTNAEAVDLQTSDQLFVADIDEILNEAVAYNFTAWWGLQILLSNQLSSVPSVSIVVTGRKVPQYDNKGNVLAVAYSQSPADITLDLLINTRTGGGMATKRIDFVKFAEWRAFCITNNLNFHGVFADPSNIWDCIQTVMRVGHAQIVPVGTLMSVAIDKTDMPVQMFGMGNIVKGTFQIEWLSLSDRANEIDVTYFERDDFYKQHTVRAIDYDALARGDPERIATVTILGIDNAATAFNEGWYQLNLNKFIKQTVSFDAPIEAIGCTVGDLILVQHDMPQWGYAGRLEAGSTTTTVNFDRPMTMTLGGDYRVLVVHSALERQGGISVVSVIRQSVFVAVSFPTPVKRLQWTKSDGSTGDAAVLDVVESSPYIELIMDEDMVAAGLTPGALISLWDTDVIEERSVNVVVGTNIMSATVTAPFSMAPAHYANFMFGENTKIKKPFRVKAVRGTQDLTRTISAFEYNASIYEGPNVAVPTPDYSALTTKIDQVQNLSIDEEVVFENNTASVIVHVNWDRPLWGLYVGANVTISVDGAPFQTVATVRAGGTTASFTAFSGDLVIAKVVAVDGAGNTSIQAAAPTLSYTVLGVTAPPPDVTGFAVQKVPGGVLYTWDAKANLTYEIRDGDWDNGPSIIQNFAGNRLVSDKNKSGTHTWFIKAINIAGIPSVNPVSVTLALPAPASVMNFQAVQNGTQIIFKWDANTEPDIAEYELREGPNWVSSQYLTRVRTTNWQMPNDVPGNRTFWIKAIDSSEIYSDIAIFCSTLVASIPDRNVLIVDDDQAAGFPGFKYNVHVDGGGSLELDVTPIYGEYVTQIDVGGTVFARITVQDAIEAIDANDTTWDQATFSWNSAAAERAWIVEGDLNSVILGKTLSTLKGLMAGDVEAFGFDGTTAGVGGMTPTTTTGTMVYAQGRYASGVHLDATHGLVYTVAVPSTFEVTFGARMQSLTGLTTILELSGAGSIALTLVFDATANEFRLEGSDSVNVSVPNFGVNVGDRLVIGISQGSTTRRLYVGRQDDDHWQGVPVAAAALGAFTTLTL